MVDLLALTVGLPLLGAGGILLLSFLFSRLDVKRGYLRVLVAALAIAIVFLLSGLAWESADGRKVILSSPYPSLLAETMVEMRWNAMLWPLGLALSVATAGLLLEAAGRDEETFRLASVLLMLLSTGLAALWSANPLTTMVCWALYDLAFALGRIVAGGRRQEAVRGLALGIGAGLLLWVGMVVAESGIGTVQWALMPPGGTKMTYWMLAALLRLSAYPLHLSFPRQIEADSPLVGALLLSPVLGWGLWIRLALASGRTVPGSPWMVIPALLTFLGGSILGWTANSSRESRPWIGMAANGAVLLATVWASLGVQGQAGEEAVIPIVVLGSVGWMLGTTALYVGAGLERGRILQAKTVLRSIPSLIISLSLLGVPATVGFVSESALMSQLGRPGWWGWSIAFFIGQVFLVAAVARWFLAAGGVERGDRGLLGKIAHGGSLIGLVGALILVGVVPDDLLLVSDSSAPSLRSMLAAPSLAGWLLWGGALLLGGVLAWLDRGFRPRISLWLDVVHDVVLLDWGYDFLMGAFEQGFSLLRVVDNVLSGRGALLWSCIVLLMLILMMGT